MGNNYILQKKSNLTKIKINEINYPLPNLKNIDELEKCLVNLKKILKPSGKIIIDLHNPQDSGKKVDSYNNMKRTMIWNYDKETKIEKSSIIFEVNDKTYNDTHIFRIFSIEKIKNICLKLGLKVEKVYENYDILKEGNIFSKNLQFIITYSNLTKS